MAAGRLISRNVAVSRKVCEASDWAFRVWATCLPFCDKHGRLPFDELDLAAICFPRMVAAGLVTAAKIADGRDELLRVGLWKKTDDGLIEIVAFAENQSNQFRPDRETRGTYVVRGVSAEEVRRKCGVIAEEVREGPRNLNLKEKVEKEGESQARAREETLSLSDSSESRRGPDPDVGSCAKNEATFSRPRIVAMIRRVLGRDGWKPSHIANTAIGNAVATFAEIPEERWESAVKMKLARVKPDALHRVADALQLLIDEGEKDPGTATVAAPLGMAYRTDELERIQRENDEILAEQVASAKRDGRSTEKLESLARQIGRPMPDAPVTKDPT